MGYICHSWDLDLRDGGSEGKGDGEELKVLTPNLRSLKIGGPKTWTAEIQHETPLRGLQNKYSEPKLHLRPMSLFGP